MKIGLTYDLKDDYRALGFTEEQVAEFDSLETIDALETVIAGLGHMVDRIGNIQTLVQRLAAGERWDMVFNIAEGCRGGSREAQVPALLDAFGIPYSFSDPFVLALSLDKGATKRILRDLGVPTSDFAVVESAAETHQVRLPFPLFVKPVAEGTSKGISPSSIVRNRRELSRECARLHATFRQPVLIEPFLTGREFTVGITGTGREAQSVGVMEVLFSQAADCDAYSYQNKIQYLDAIRYQLVDDAMALEAERIALDSWRGLNCRDGGRVDLRADALGRILVMELNPLPGLNPTYSDLPILARMAGIPYETLIGRIFRSAEARVARTPAARRQRPYTRPTAAAARARRV